MEATVKLLKEQMEKAADTIEKATKKGGPGARPQISTQRFTRIWKL
jgi:hypothetical protein